MLSVIMIFSLFSVCAAAAEDTLKITVANDLHLNLAIKANIVPGKYTAEDYSHVPAQGQLRLENALLIDDFFRQAAENDSDCVLIPGDLVDRGSDKEHTAMAAKLAAFEAASGKSVYVVPGNHDYYGGATPDEFKEFYKDFGYSEALATDSATASYTADLGGDYRLIAVDSCVPGDGVHGIDEARIEWIKAQAEKAKADGKKLISMMHHNVVEHFIFGGMLHEASVIEKSTGLQELYAQYNIKYSFVGHTHEQDIASFTGSNGNTIYDIVTNSLNSYPCPYRTVTFGDSVRFETKYIEEIDMSSLKGVISDNCYNLATTDFREYTRQCAMTGVGEILDSYITPAKIKSLLRLDASNQEHAKLIALVDEYTPLIRDLLYMPVNQADETEAGKSIESLAEAINLDIPATDFKNFAELGLHLYEEHVVGDENFGIFSAEFNLLSVTVTVFLAELLKDVTALDYANVMNFICNYFGADIPVNFLRYAGSAIKRIEGIEMLLSSVLNAVALQFTTDDGLADNNATLPGYDDVPAEDAPAEKLSLWDKIVNFFLSFFDKILRFFGVGR